MEILKMKKAFLNVTREPREGYFQTPPEEKDIKHRGRYAH